MTTFALDLPDVVALHPAGGNPPVPRSVDSYELADRVLRRARHAPLAPGLVTSGGVTYSYGWLRDTIRETAAMLRRRVPEGRAVAIAGCDHPLLAVTVLASWFARLPVLLLDDATPVERRQRVLREAGAAVVLRLCCHEETGVPVFDLIDLPAPEGGPYRIVGDPRDDPMMTDVILPLTLGSPVQVPTSCGA